MRSSREWISCTRFCNSTSFLACSYFNWFCKFTASPLYTSKCIIKWKLLIEPRQAKMCLRVMSGQRRPRSDCANHGCLSAPRIIGYLECINREQRIRWDLARAQDDLNLPILRMLKGTFSLDAAQLTFRFWLDMDYSSLCRFYFNLGATHTDILYFLAQIHGVCVSKRTVDRCLVGQQRSRDNSHFTILSAVSLIEKEIKKQLSALQNIPDSAFIHRRCIRDSIAITKYTVEILMEILDPVKVESRLRRKIRRQGSIGPGPDYIWHIGYCPGLHQYGLNLHACMDGFSGYIVFANACTVHSTGQRVADSYLQTVEMCNGCPVCIIGNNGLKSDKLAQMQTILTGANTFLQTQNVKVSGLQAFWKFVRDHFTQRKTITSANWMKEEILIKVLYDLNILAGAQHSLQGCIRKKRRLRSACASEQSYNISLCCLSEYALDP